jgi:CRISPR-associated protein, Cse2 family
MTDSNKQELKLPDFVGLKDHYEHRLTNGQRAELRKVSKPDMYNMVPSFYRLVRDFLSPEERPDKKWRRLVYLLPYINHADEAASLGTTLLNEGIQEMRIFQMIRSSEPNDLIHLRRILQQVHPSVDWREFGRSIYLWGSWAKQKILEDYYLA